MMWDTHTHTHTQNGILFSHKKNEILLFAATWLDLEGIMLSKISQTEKDKYCIWFTYMWNLKKKKTVNITKIKQAQRYRKQTSGHCWGFQICWHIECSTLTASSFTIWNSLAGILSPPVALLVLSKGTWLHTLGYLVVGEWPHYCGYPAH